ncbi:DUF4296 domain-containing protein [Patiriisocius sp. Uisw_017]|jgi:hypothetical protein|uniref:DUF4296 domain-containing protein n=1 Tax=Patiriisocius sp. Uisw_017 TaxID=3230968 RepID=UPI0039EB3118
MNTLKTNKRVHSRLISKAEKLKFSIVFILFWSVIISCQNVQKPEALENLIPENEMVAILTESYLMNAARSVDNNTISQKGIKLDSILYKKYTIDSLQFAQSNAYYSTNLNTYKAIFAKVEENLTLEKTKRDTLYERFKRAEIERRRLDSIAFVQDSIEALEEEVDVEKLMEEENEEKYPDSIRGSLIKRGISLRSPRSQDSLL